MGGVLKGAALAGLMTAMPAVAADPVSAPAPVSAVVPHCAVMDAGREAAGAPALLYAQCPGGSLRLGEAASYTAQVNALTGALLVVRQSALRTEIDLVRIGADGVAHLDELAGDVVNRLAAAGQGRPRQFTVDAAGFALTGAISIGGGAGARTPALDLTAYLQPDVAATAAAPVKG